MERIQTKPRTPSKIRSRREQTLNFSIDEIPTRDESPQVTRHTPDQKPNRSMRDGSRSTEPFRRSCPELIKRGSRCRHTRRHSEDRQMLKHMYESISEGNDSADSLATANIHYTHAVPMNNSASSKHSSSAISLIEGTNTDMHALTHSIYKHWKNGQFCDVRINAGEQTFHAHKLVLAAACKNIPLNVDGSNNMLEIDIPQIRPDVMNEVLTFFYTSNLTINSKNVEDLLEISQHLGIHKILHLCLQFLKRISLRNAVYHLLIARKFGLTDVISAINEYIYDHFVTLATTSSFLKGDFHLVYDIISSDMLTATHELPIFHACASWINYNQQERKKYAVPLMSLVRFVNICPADIVSQVEPVAFMFEMPECKDMLYNAFRHHALLHEQTTTPHKHLATNVNHSSHVRQDMVEQINSSSGHVSDTTGNQKSKMSDNRKSSIDREDLKPQKHSRPVLSNSGSNVYTSTRSVPISVGNETSRHTYFNTEPSNPNVIKPALRTCSENSENTVHSIINKFRNASVENGIHSSGLSLARVSDFESEVSTAISHSATPRSTFRSLSPGLSQISKISASSNGCVITPDLPPPPRPSVFFILGGLNHYFHHDPKVDNATKTVQQFDPVLNSWSIRTRLPLHLHHAAVTVLEEKLYVIGGNRAESSDTVPSRDCYRYDVYKDYWDFIAPLKTARMRHAVVTLNGVVYALGGEDCVEMSVKTMEYYNLEENKWKFTHPMTDARVGLAAAGHRGRIMAVGGMLDTDKKIILDTVEIYDPREDSWTFKFPLQIAVCGAALAEINGDVYLVGGYVMRENEPLSVDSVFRYRDETDSWEGFETLRVPRHGAVVAKLNTRLYIIGGESSAAMGDALSNVECIDVETKNHVTGVAPLKTSAYGICGCVFT